ncbi:hypothetical protein BpOF4_01640 [Alkalihalophilus pseudofirmus OF4]|uniref:Uncharacterized protein n=1 Tax=Alkalihalophilus pseudofirmus (strain ATCC BAA-2126 / JCM 17055 / OF4) TaxID=398511 RepID=D3FUX0_ALKPO|nr:hypothetical protein BpOF4_01640 [Alkalihalophilus pseudofirmus OF4]
MFSPPFLLECAKNQHSSCQYLEQKKEDEPC